MGNLCVSKPEPSDVERQQKEASDAIEKMLREQKKGLKKEVKLLLLGAGESGKSTFAKQMKILHLEGFTQEECLASRPIIYCNIFDSCHKLIRAAKTQFHLTFGEDITEAVAFLEGIDLAEDLEMNKKIADYVKALWKDSTIQEAYDRASEFQLNDSTKYFFEEIDRIAKPDYVPSEDDMLRLRNKTSGVIETCFEVKGTKFRMVDVGGQRNERRKWYHCFEDVTSVLFLVAMSEYNLFLEEDETTNRMKESINLFRDIINNQWFKNTSIMLFLNKLDLFEEKIKKVDLKVCFTTYKDGCDFEKAKAYMKARFLQNNHNPDRLVQVHFTCATDKKNAEVVFNGMYRDIMSRLLKEKL
jgi:GTPase SAR1 family protein